MFNIRNKTVVLNQQTVYKRGNVSYWKVNEQYILGSSSLLLAHVNKE